MKRLLRTVSVLALLAGATPAFAQVPVEDVVAIGRLAETVRLNIGMLNTAIETLTISNAMKAALGEGLGGEWASALSSAEGLYNEGGRLIYNAQTKQMRLQSEIDSLIPQDVANMDVRQLTAFARRWQYALQNDSLAMRALQAEGIAQQGKINELKSRSIRSSANAQGVTSAVQAQTNLLGAVAGQLETTGMTLASIANMQNNSLMTDERKNQITEQWMRRNREIGAQMRAAGIQRAARSPLLWGTP